MRGQGEPEQDIGLGKKVDTPPAETPEWKPHPNGKKDFWINAKGQTAYSPKTPPRQLTPAEAFYEVFGIQPYGGF